MAVEKTKATKRKGATDLAPDAKKSKTTKRQTVTAQVQCEDGSHVAAKPEKRKRKQGADFFEGEETIAAPVSSDSKKPKSTKSKKTQVLDTTAQATTTEDLTSSKETAAAVESTKKRSKKGLAAESALDESEQPSRKKKKISARDLEPSKAKGRKSKVEAEANTTEKINVGAPHSDSVVPQEADESVEEDDQTAALLAGFESDEEQSDPEDDLQFKEDLKIPTPTNQNQKKLRKAMNATSADESGVVYVGRVPRGFFEPQMKKYFSQFGRIRNLRLSRNKKTGASKHYAFVEFESREVADIVARTMNNYLLFGHILKCHLLSPEQVHEDLFKGAEQRFKVDPRNKKAGLDMERGTTRERWEKRIENEQKRRDESKATLLKDFDYEFVAPALTPVAQVPQQTLTLPNGNAPTNSFDGNGALASEELQITVSQDGKTIEAHAESHGELPASKKPKKKKSRAEGLVDDSAAAPVAEVKTSAAKSRKSKSAPTEEAKDISEVAEPIEKKRKTRANGDVAKTKKSKKSKV